MKIVVDLVPHHLLIVIIKSVEDENDVVWEELQGVTFESSDLLVTLVTMVSIGALELFALDVSFEALLHGLFIFDDEIDGLEGLISDRSVLTVPGDDLMTGLAFKMFGHELLVGRVFQFGLNSLK